MKPTRWDPFREFDRLFADLTAGEQSVERPGQSVGCWVPKADIVEDEEKTLLMLELPGVKKEDVSVKVDSGILTIDGVRHPVHSDKKDQYRRMERCFGKFERRFSLPDTVDVEKISAGYGKGVMTLALPKKPKAVPRQIDIAVS